MEVKVDPRVLPSGSHSPGKLDCGLNWLLDRAITHGRGCYGDGRPLLSWEQLRARQIPNNKEEFAEAYKDEHLEQLIRRTPNTFTLQPLQPLHPSDDEGEDAGTRAAIVTPDPKRVSF